MKHLTLEIFQNFKEKYDLEIHLLRTFFKSVLYVRNLDIFLIQLHVHFL